MSRRSGPNIEAARNPGLFLGALLAAAWSEGRDKVTLIADPPYESFLSWVEQLLAESSGKDGKGLYPIAGEPPTTPRHYGPDRMMIYLRADGGHDARVEPWIKAGIPVAILSLRDSIQDLGAEFFRWEVATAIACHIIGVNAFDQPDVQRAKDAARRALKDQGRGIHKAAASPSSPSKAFAAALADLREGDALALLAFLPRTLAARRSLVGVRRRVRDRKGNATIVGFGPGYLHSTGQLFKGGPDRMVAVVLLASAGADLEVPGAGHTLGGLMRAQAEGDVEAMRVLGRRVHLIPLTSARGLADLTRAAPSRAKSRSTRSRRSG